MATSGLSWRSEFGPRPCVTPRRREEGIGRADHQAEEERGHEVEDERRPADHRVGGLPAVAPHEDGGDHGQDEAPQQDGAGERRPHAGDRVEQRRDRAVVLGDEDEREVVGDERVLHRPAASSAPTSMHGREAAGRHPGRPAPGRRRARAPVRTARRRAGRGRGPARPTHATQRRPAMAGDEGEPDPDRPELGVDHQQTVPSTSP